MTSALFRVLKGGKKVTEEKHQNEWTRSVKDEFSAAICSLSNLFQSVEDSPDVNDLLRDASSKLRAIRTMVEFSEFSYPVITGQGRQNSRKQVWWRLCSKNLCCFFVFFLFFCLLFLPCGGGLCGVLCVDWCLGYLYWMLCVVLCGVLSNLGCLSDLIFCVFVFPCCLFCLISNYLFFFSFSFPRCLRRKR